MHTAKCFFTECQNKGTRQRCILPSAKKIALGKIHLCQVPEKRHSAKTHFAECRKMALGKIHLCRVPKKTLGKAIFVEYFFFLPSAFYLALGKDHLCRVPDKIHSAKPPAMGKVPVSDSVGQILTAQAVTSQQLWHCTGPPYPSDLIC